MNKPTFKAATLSASISSGIAPRFDVPASAAPASAQTESAADRIMLTLLALGLMLLAFFVVLTSSASYDQRRTRDVARGIQAVFVPAKDQAGKGDGETTDADLQAAVGALRAAVSDIFSGVLPRDVGKALPDKNRLNPDRVEIDVPMSVFFADNEAVLFPLPALGKIVAVLAAPPAGYRMELVVRAAGENADPALDQARIAALADGLVRHGLAPMALSVGTLQNAATAGARSLRFTFLLLNADDDLAAVRMMTGKVSP